MWFNKECHDSKAELNAQAKQLRADHTNHSLRGMLMNKKRDYKNTLRKTKKEFQTTKMHELTSCKGNSYNFWRKFNSFKTGNMSDKIKIPPKKLFDHFSQLVYSKSGKLFE